MLPATTLSLVSATLGIECALKSSHILLQDVILYFIVMHSLLDLRQYGEELQDAGYIERNVDGGGPRSTCLLVILVQATVCYLHIRLLTCGSQWETRFESHGGCLDC